MIKKCTCVYCGKELENTGLCVKGEDGFYCDDCDVYYDETTNLDVINELEVH